MEASSTMTIGIWGAGLVGRALVSSFVERQMDVCVLNRSIDKPFFASGKKIPMRHMSFAANEDQMVSALTGISVLVHCAGNIADDYSQFVQAANRLAAAAVRARVVRVLMVSTVGVYGDAITDVCLTDGAIIDKAVSPEPSSPYGISRYAAEIDMRAILEATGIEYSVVRIPMVLSKDMSVQVFKKIRYFLDRGFFPELGKSSASLPCIRLEKLQTCIAQLVCSRSRLAPLYQFSEYLLWSTVLESYTIKTGKKVRVIPLPGLVLLRAFRIFGLKYFAFSLQVLMNEATFGDDSLYVIDELAMRESGAIGVSISSGEVESILW